MQANDFAGIEWFVDVLLSRNRVEGLHVAGCKRPFLAWISSGEAEESPAPDRYPEAGARSRAYLIGDDDPKKLTTLEIAEKIRQLRLQGLTEEQIKRRLDPLVETQARSE